MSEETKGGSEESQAPSLIDDLTKAFDEFEAAEAETDDAKDATETDTKAAQESQADESVEGAGDAEDEVSVDEDDESSESEEAEDESAESESAEVLAEAPEHWSEDDKTAFDELPDEAKPLYLDKVKSLESGFNRKFEDLATERKEVEAYTGFKELFNPYEAQLQAAGHTPESYTRNLVNTALALRTDPVEAIKSIAVQHGVDLTQLAGKPANGADDPDFDEFTDPAILKLYEKVDGLTNQFTHSQQSQQQAQQQDNNAQALQEWQTFTVAKSEDGADLHPGAAKLRVFIGTHLQTDPPKPGETTQDALRRAYDAVKWTDPSIREASMEADRKAADAEREKQRKADLEKAKKAGRTVKSKSAPVAEKPKVGKTWKDELESQWDTAASG